MLAKPPKILNQQVPQSMVGLQVGVLSQVFKGGIMKDETAKSYVNTVLIYLAGSIHASALCFLAFVLAYKAHVHFGTPIPGLDGLSVALVVCTFIFKKIIEKDLEGSGTSIKDALPKLVSRTVYGVLALVLVLNMDTIVNSIIEFNRWFLSEFKSL